MEQQIHLKPFDPTTDAPRFVDFYNDVFAPLRPLYSWPLTVERLLDRVVGNWEYRPDGFLLAFAGEQLAGAMLVGTRLLALTENDRAETDSPVAYISFIAVAPEFRRRGIGRRLHDEAEAFASRYGCQMITPTANPSAPMAFFIAVQQDWTDAQAFFRAMGYQEAGCQQNFHQSLADVAVRPPVPLPPGFTCRVYRPEDRESLIALSDWPYWVLDLESKFGTWTKTHPFIETCMMGCATDDIVGPDETAVVVHDGQVVAYCAQTINPRTGWAYLGPVMTRPDMENRGLGSAVLQLSLKIAAAKGALMCDIWTGLDEHHSHFYLRNGGRRVMTWQRFEKTLV